MTVEHQPAKYKIVCDKCGQSKLVSDFNLTKFSDWTKEEIELKQDHWSHVEQRNMSTKEYHAFEYCASCSENVQNYLNKKD